MSANSTGKDAEIRGDEAGPEAGQQAGQAGPSTSVPEALRAFDLESFIRTARETRGVVPLGALPRVHDLLPSDAPAGAVDSPLRWVANGEMRKVLRRRGAAAAPVSSAAARSGRGSEAADQPVGAFQATEPHLTLTIEGDVWLECQRCMQPFSWPVSVGAGYRVARDERQADVLAGDDADDDVIVGSAAFDLLDLIDEEIMLSLPMVPKHRVCPAVHESVVSGADGALGVDGVEDIEARLTEAAGTDPTPLPGERKPTQHDDAPAASVPAMPTRRPFAAALAGWPGTRQAGKPDGAESKTPTDDGDAAGADSSKSD